MVRKMAIVEILCVVVLAGGCGLVQQPVDIVSEPYLLDTGLVSRSISFENPTGAPGESGKAASKLGVASEVLIAQAALETGWGQKVIHRADGRSSFNLFGIKAGAASAGI